MTPMDSPSEATPNQISLPHRFDPRGYQLPLYRAMDGGCLRGIQVWHRRAGKDKTDFNYVVKRAARERGAYYYYFPTMAQGRKILWEGMDRSGMPFLHHIPPELLAGRPDNQEMKLTLVNGSIIRVVGTDRTEVVGPNPRGCVFSEFSLQNPRAWNYVRPILAENGGWAIFNFTPRGRNHAWRLLRMAKGNPGWFTQLLTVDDTGAISKEAIEDERRAGMSEDLIQQEFYCSFDLGMEGAYYAKILTAIAAKGQVGRCPYDPAVPVYTVWDLGVGDSTAIWFVQFVGQEIHLIGYYEASGEPLEHYAKVIKAKGWLYAKHLVPHDANARSLQTGRSLVDLAKLLGLVLEVQPATGVEYGIEVVRGLLGRCWFDEVDAAAGLEALEQYRKAVNERLSDEQHTTFMDHPLHDWTSHGADAFRVMAVYYRQAIQGLFDTNRGPNANRQQQAVRHTNPYG